MAFDISSLAGVIGLGALAAMIGVAIAVVILIIVALYIYTSWAWMTIAKKLKYKNAWLAWIPFANVSMMLQLGNFHWALVFLALIPILGWIALIVLVLISTWRIFEKRKYPGWMALIPIATYIPKLGFLAGIAYLIILGFVAWKK